MSLLPKDEISRKYMLLGFKITGDFGVSIAIPVVLFVWIAQWAEEKYGGSPYLTILAFVLAAFLTVKIIMKRAKEYDSEYKKLNKLREEKNNINKNLN